MYNLIISKKSILILTVFTLALHTVRCDGEDSSNLSNRMFKKKPLSSYTTGALSSSDELLSDSDVRILSNDSDSPVDKSKNSTIIFGVHKESESIDRADNFHGMPKIHLDFTPIQNRIKSNSRCSNTEIDQIMKGIKGVKPWIDKTYADWDRKLYEKWFGTVNDNGLSDKQVFHRFKRAYDFMYDEDPKWEVMCCDQAIGGCTSCSNGVLAYVTYWYYQGDKDSHRKNVHIRLCPDLFNTEDATEVIGVTMFHEVMHITSHAGDSCYSKKDCYNLAQTEPSKARLNANSYT